MLLDYNLQDNLRLSKVSLTLIPSLQACTKAGSFSFSGALDTHPPSPGWDLAATKKLSLLFVRQQCSISSQLFKGSERSFKTRITTEPPFFGTEKFRCRSRLGPRPTFFFFSNFLSLFGFLPMFQSELLMVRARLQKVACLQRYWRRL